MNERSRRDFLQGIGGAAAFAAFMGSGIEFMAACANSGQVQPTAALSPKAGGHITEGGLADAKLLTPFLVNDTTSSLVSGLMFESLLSSKANGELIPQLAGEVPKPSADGLTYTFKLRKGLKWSDGRPLTSDDVLFTYSLHLAPKYRAVNSPWRQDMETHVASIAAPDPETFVLKTKRTFAPTLINMGGPGFGLGIVPKHVLGNANPTELNAHDFNQAPSVTNGLFKFVKWDPGQIVLARNDKYWAGKSFLDRYVYKVLPNQAAVANQLKTGEIDIAGGGAVGEQAVDDLLTHTDTLAVVQFDVAIFDFYIYQLDPSQPAGKLFADKIVRQALLYGLNRQPIVEALYFKHASVATGPVSPAHYWAYNKDAKPRYTFDKVKAEQMLDAAGWRKGPFGIREKDGVPLRFEVIATASSKVRAGIVRLFQQQWAEIGVQCTPRLLQFSELVSQIQKIRTFDMVILDFNWGQDPDQSSLWHSRNAAPGGINGGMFKDSTVDKILEDAVGTLDQNKRKQLYYQLQDTINDLAPMPILTFRKGLWGINNRVKGITGSDRGLGTYTQYYTRPWMKDVFVTDGR